MAIITLRLPSVNSHPTARPSQCRFCGQTILQKWGTVTKPVRDAQLRTVLVHRYHCPACRRTFRHYPTGIERVASLHLQQLAALCWQCDFTRNVSGLLNAFGIALAHMPAVRKRRRGRASPLYRLKQLVLHLSEHWSEYRLYQERAEVPRTNNRAEQAIGRWRTRSRSVRGFKSAPGWQSAFWVCANGSL